jgi:hypothetical protein
VAVTRAHFLKSYQVHEHQRKRNQLAEGFKLLGDNSSEDTDNSKLQEKK